MQQKGITHQELADKTGLSVSNVGRMLQGKYKMSLDNFLELAAAVGVEIVIKENL